MFALLLIAALQTPTTTDASSIAPARNGFQCTATDYQGVYTTGYGETKNEAEDRALQSCQARSRAFCVSTGCLPYKF